MAKYRFEQIAINSTEKKKPVEEDRFTYHGLEHLDSGCLKVTRFGSDVAPIGEKLVMRKGDVLFGKRRAYQKKVAIAPFDGIFSAHGMVLRPNVEVIDPDFFPLFISSDYFLDAAIKISVGSLSPTINWRDLKILEFELPNLETQHKLAAVLWSINDTMESYKKLIAATNELVKSQFIELFGDPKYNKSNLVKIGEIGVLTSGGTPSRAKPEYFEGDIRWYSAGELNSLYLPDSIEHISEMALQQSSAKLFNKGTLMIGMYDTAAFKMGILTEDSSSNQACANLNPQQGYNIVWLYYLFDIMKPIFLQERQGVRQKNLSLSKIKEFEVPFAPFELQEQFATFVHQTDKSKFELEQALAALTATYKRIIAENLG